MSKEIWKDIPGYKGLYQASNKGRFKSLKTGNFILPTFMEKRNGIGLVSLRRKKNEYKVWVAARIIAQLFIPNPKKLGVVKCRGDRKNLNASNWFWMSYGDMISEGAKGRPFIVRNLRCKKCRKKFVVVKSNAPVRYCSQMCARKMIWRTMDRKARKKFREMKHRPVVGKRKDEMFEFESLMEAAEFVGRDPSGVSNTIAGRQRHCAGWKFKFI